MPSRSCCCMANQRGPTRREDHTYARHVEWMRALAFDVLDLQRVTLFGQDWGGG